MTVTPVGSRVLYTWPQVRPGPISTVLSLGLSFVELKRDNAICTPEVDENPGFAVCPPPFTAKGVLRARRIFSCAKSKNEGQRAAITIGAGYLTILLTSSAEPGSTEHAESWMLERA